MNRIEEKMTLLQEKKEKALIMYMMAGLPDMEGTKELIRAQAEEGVDVVELGIPFSDPIADGPVIQDASYRSICLGTNVTKAFAMMEELREEGFDLPVVFKIYYNTILHYGVRAFAQRCREAGVDGLSVPDLPLEEQRELKDALEEKEGAILIQLVSPSSKERIPSILKDARGFVCFVSDPGVPGQACDIHKEVTDCLKEVKQISEIPVMLSFGACMPENLAPVKDFIDGVAAGTEFMKLLEEAQYGIDAAKTYCYELKKRIFGVRTA